MIYLYNTLTKKKEKFIPITPNKVLFYLCGVTVYDYCHIGHARAYVIFDCIRRHLEHSGYDVKFIQNFTDIDDKIIDRANENKEHFEDLTTRFIDAYFEDMDALSIKRATYYPKATDYISHMITLITKLIDKGYAYNCDGDICFSIKTYKKYGQLSKKVLEDLEAGTRVDINDKKESPFDFVLWKKAKPNEPSWPSPWGEGRPGWHIECSAMALKELGPSIDIHGGGEDLIFPHHENERAQSECYTQTQFASYWLHNGFVNINKEKMSKSKKNFFTIRELLEKYSGDIIRFFLIKSHYRSMINFTFKGLDESKTALMRLQITVESNASEQPTNETKESFNNFETKFNDALNDDFNTPDAIGILFEINKLINTSKSGKHLLKKLTTQLGLFEQEKNTDPLSETITELIDQRQLAKTNKNYQEADTIRDKLLNDYNIILEDTPEGPTWRKNE